MELFKASRQWATRPADERFVTMDEMFNVCKGYADQAAESTTPHSDIRVEVADDDLRLTGKSGTLAKFTHWAFGQISRLAEAPAEYLRKLPATLAAQNLNHGLKEHTDSTQAQLLFHKNGDLVLRSYNSDRYVRIWNWEIVKRLIPLTNKGWKTPPSITGPAGLYASDHDMFVFLVNEESRIKDGSDEGLARGFFVENSEVGAASFKLTQFLYRYVCGNHIVWGAKDVKQIAVRHVGLANENAFGKLQVELTRYANESVSDLEAKIARTKTFELGKTKDEVLDKLFGMRIIPRKTLELAYESTEQNPVDGSPRTAWGMAQGVTRLSQKSVYADERSNMDRAAGKILEIVF